MLLHSTENNAIFLKYQSLNAEANSEISDDCNDYKTHK